MQAFINAVDERSYQASLDLFERSALLGDGTALCYLMYLDAPRAQIVERLKAEADQRAGGEQVDVRRALEGAQAPRVANVGQQAVAPHRDAIAAAAEKRAGEKETTALNTKKEDTERLRQEETDRQYALRLQREDLESQRVAAAELQRTLNEQKAAEDARLAREAQRIAEEADAEEERAEARRQAELNARAAEEARKELNWSVL